MIFNNEDEENTANNAYTLNKYIHIRKAMKFYNELTCLFLYSYHGTVEKYTRSCHAKMHHNSIRMVPTWKLLFHMPSLS